MCQSQEAVKSEIARVSVKIPPFWRKNVSVWLYQVESQFVTSGITSEITKYHYVLGSLDPEIAELLSDLVCTPVTEASYATLKGRLIKEFEESETSKTKKLITELELGDKKPTTLLREMRSLAGQQVTDDFLKNLFLQRLPNNVKSILATSNDTVDNLAVMADKIIDISPSTTQHIAQLQTNTNENNLNELRQQITELTTSVNELKFQRSRSIIIQLSPKIPFTNTNSIHFTRQHKKILRDLLVPS
ncbi:hypothetical protein RI129_011750 [Pyrocoelia pectoralis]|uniref:DUF7041 domain-containing protein n=1 Tax=Pyrocoelia pectoralis TaxID=417401 RepID=A0AAN7V519_9COLE